jgi:sulfatase maturation enzyme AslB (radical SAM superfamily)
MTALRKLIKQPLPAVAPSIEQGYFVFTLMPSLRCSLNCPHCYLSKEQRRNSEILAPEALSQICSKVDEYYQNSGIEDKTIVCYWYGGEPLQYEKSYLLDLIQRIESVFTPEKGYRLKHTILSSLVTVDEDWFPHLMRHGQGYIQTSFDGVMRGNGYVRTWEKKVRQLKEYGFRVGTISVVNHTLLREGPAYILDYLSELGIVETSFLPFMLNEQNNGEKYEKFAPTMSEYSEFMIKLTERYFERQKAGQHVPEIGQMRFILEQTAMDDVANIAGQTLFLLPNGDFVLPDYRNGYLEFMQPFGNILQSSFADVLNSPARRAYLRRQFLRNHNPECIGCDYSGNCIMEFWKSNREGDDCFGAKRYVEWLLGQRAERGLLVDIRKTILH